MRDAPDTRISPRERVPWGWALVTLLVFVMQLGGVGLSATWVFLIPETPWPVRLFFVIPLVLCLYTSGSVVRHLVLGVRNVLRGRNWFYDASWDR